MTEDYVRLAGRMAYLWGWPLVNMHNRLPIMEKLPGPGLLGGVVVPAASPGCVGMLHDYITPGKLAGLAACRLDPPARAALLTPPLALRSQGAGLPSAR